jgi:hypothetical protein
MVEQNHASRLSRRMSITKIGVSDVLFTCSVESCVEFMASGGLVQGMFTVKDVIKIFDWVSAVDA